MMKAKQTEATLTSGKPLITSGPQQKKDLIDQVMQKYDINPATCQDACDFQNCNFYRNVIQNPEYSFTHCIWEMFDNKELEFFYKL